MTLDSAGVPTPQLDADDRRCRRESGEGGSCLQALHLQKTYGARKVVKDVSLAVRKG
jgi:hypothetical protein